MSCFCDWWALNKSCDILIFMWMTYTALYLFLWCIAIISTQILISVGNNVFSIVSPTSYWNFSLNDIQGWLESIQGTCRLSLKMGRGDEQNKNFWCIVSDGNQYWFQIFRKATSPKQWYLQIDMLDVGGSLKSTLEAN